MCTVRRRRERGTMVIPGFRCRHLCSLWRYSPRKETREQQVGFGTWIRLEHVELGIPVSLLSRDTREEPELGRGVWDGDGGLVVTRLQIEIETMGVGHFPGRMCDENDVRRTLRSTVNVHWSEKGGPVS